MRGAWLLLVLTLVSCGRSPGEQAFSLAYTRAGFAEESFETLAFDAADRTLRIALAPDEGPVLIPLSEQEAVLLRDRAKAVQRHDGERFECDHCPQPVRHEVMVTVDGRTSRVQWESPSHAPAEVYALQGVLYQWIERAGAER